MIKLTNLSLKNTPFNCVKSNLSFFKFKFSVFNFNREVGYQLITNLIFLLEKLKGEPSYHALVLREILSRQFISLFIMYKTWRNSKIREKCLELLDLTKMDLLDIKMRENEMGIMTEQIKEEIDLLNSLQNHICIREDIKQKLRKMFN